MTIHLLYGKDSFLVRQALGDIRAELAQADDMLDTNTTVLDGRSISAGELLSHATAVPFLANSRLVIVDGLIGHIGEGRRSRRAPKKKPDANDPLQPWRDAGAQLADPATMPPTTTLVFVEGEFRRGKTGSVTNPAFAIFAPLARVAAHDGLGKDELPDWIRRTAEAKDVKLAPRAIAALTQLIGPDLWTLTNEIDKLSAYAAGGTVDETIVSTVVSGANETKVWDLTDAIVAGDTRSALSVLQRLLRDGEPAPLIAFMIVRQYRQIALVKDMRERRVRQEEMARVAAVPSFRLSAVGSLAARYSWAQVRDAYKLLLDADLAVKRGVQSDESSLQLLLHELCALAAESAGARRYPSRTGSAAG